MSVVNQVLNRLEQRGVHVASDQTMVRAVPLVRHQPAMPLLILGLVLAIGIAAWQWMPLRKPDAAATSVAQYPPAGMAAVTPASAVIAAEPQEQEVMEMFVPSSRLSFELSSVPLPSSLREMKDSASPGRDRRLVENLASSGHGRTLGEDSPGKDTPATKQVLKPLPAQAANANARTAAQPLSGGLPLKQISPAQRADAEFRKAAALMQRGRSADAMAGYEAALQLDVGHDAARQAWVALLLEGGRRAEAEQVLQDGLKIKPEHTGFAMLLARLQVEREAVEQAKETLGKTLPYADRQADYQAFFAALLQRLNRHKEAITHYQIALQLAPDNGIWLMGYGISLQAVQRNTDARDAFKRALDAKTLNPELQKFVQQKLKEL